MLYLNFLHLNRYSISMSSEFFKIRLFYVFCYCILCPPPLPLQQHSCSIPYQPDASPVRILQRLCRILSLQRFQHLPNTVCATYISTDKRAAGLSPRHSRAICLFEVEIDTGYFIIFNFCSQYQLKEKPTWKS